MLPITAAIKDRCNDSCAPRRTTTKDIDHQRCPAFPLVLLYCLIGAGLAAYAAHTDFVFSTLINDAPNYKWPAVLSPGFRWAWSG